MPVVQWRFDNTYTRLPRLFYSKQGATAAPAPKLVLLNHALARDLGLDFSGTDDAALAALFSGNALPEGAEPFAQAYAGHQFGGFSLLGDGRALVLGEHVAPDGRRVDIQFKGSGPTRYSRSGDGRAALGPMLREYVISEAMQALGIPTTRSLAVVATGQPVYRERPLPGAVLTRVAASHLRVGTFQYAAAQGDPALVAQLVDYAIDRHYPHLKDAASPGLALLQAVGERQLALVVEWLRVGFIHGVMNTDNVTIAGETIDYGPCAFMDAHDPTTVFSSIDHQGRYAFGNQPRIMLWNLARFAESLLPSIDADGEKAVELATASLHALADIFEAGWLAMMGRKLGLSGSEPDDRALCDDLLSWMTLARADHTNTFRALAVDALPSEAVFDDPAFGQWHARWRARLGRQGDALPAVFERMRAANPAYIPRNHQVEAALAAGSAGDLAPMHRLLEVMADPYAARDGLDEYAQPAVPDGRVYQTFCGT
ncbi:MAG: protein adenylyltransferase SelO [bacterium]